MQASFFLSLSLEADAPTNTFNFVLIFLFAYRYLSDNQRYHKQKSNTFLTFREQPTASIHLAQSDSPYPCRYLSASHAHSRCPAHKLNPLPPPTGKPDT